MKKIVLTGGGTAGHVTPNIALVPKLKESGFEIKYIGTYNGMEKQLVEDAVLTISVFLQVSFAVILAGRIFLILSVF